VLSDQKQIIECRIGSQIKREILANGLGRLSTELTSSLTGNKLKVLNTNSWYSCYSRRGRSNPRRKPTSKRLPAKVSR